MADKFSNEDIYVETGYDNIILIDPNKVTSKQNADGEPRLVQHENLVYYANLETKIIPRTKLAIGEAFDSNPVVNTTIASFAGGDEELNLSFLKPKGKTQFDTSWSDQITGKGSREGKAPNQTSEYAVTFDGKTQYRRKVLNYEDTQLLGIKSINVEITPAGTPKVRMTLVDVQGRALFEQGDNSMYSVFFNLPYPAFYLTLKGYYGKAIRLQLMLKSFNAKFSPDSGNFEIDLELIGRLNALLFDTILGYSRNAPKMLPRIVTKKLSQGGGKSTTTQVNSTLGRQKLEEVYKQYKDKKLIDRNFDEIDLQEFISRIENYDKNALARSNEADFLIINHISDFEDNLKNLESVVYNSSKSKFIDTTKPYVWLNDEVYFFFKSSVNKSDRIDRVNNLKSAFDTYLKLLKSNPAFGSTNVFNLKLKNGTLKNVGIKIAPFNYDSNLGFKSVSEKKDVNNFKSQVDWQKTYIYRFKQTPTPIELSNFKLSEEASIGQNAQIWNGASIVTESPDIFHFGERWDNGPNINNSFLDIIKKSRETLDKQKKIVEDEIYNILSGLVTDKNALGFEPTIRNVFCVILAGADTFFKLMDDVHERAWSQRQNKLRLDLVVNGKVGPDYNKSVELSSGVLKNEAIVYPWPLYYEKTTDKNKRELYEIKYVGDANCNTATNFCPVRSNPTVWPEVEFSEDYIRAASMTNSPIPINNYNNPKNQLKFATFNALEFPFKYTPYSNPQPASFVYELFERCFLNTHYTKMVRNGQISGLSQLIGQFEAENALDQIQSDNTLNTIFSNQIKFYTDLITGLQTYSTQNYANYQANNFVTTYLIDELNIENSVYSIDSIASTSPTVVGGVDIADKIKNYLKSTQSNKLSFLDTYPFSNLNWLKKNLTEGGSINSVESANKTTESFDFNTQKKIISRLNQSGSDTISLFTNRNCFNNGSQKVLGIPSSTDKYSINSRLDLKSYYDYRLLDKGNNLQFTELITNYGTSYSGEVKSLIQTTSIFNTPYFVNAIIEGVKKEKVGDKNPYAALGYLFLNSLPLITTKEKLKKVSNSNSNIQTDIDYLYATLNKFSAIHQVPYSWILKYGSIWHRYKVWNESNRITDILDNVWKDFDYKSNYSPTNSLTNSTYNLLDFQNNPIQYALQTSNNQVIDGITRQVDNINLGFYPKVINDFYYYFSRKDLFIGYTTNDLSGTTQSKKLKIGKNNDAAFLLPLSGDSTEKDRIINLQNFYQYMDAEGNLELNVGEKYLLFPSCGAIDINQSVWESYNTTNNKKEELLDNAKMYNGSVRSLWFTGNFGYFDNSLLVKPKPFEYIRTKEDTLTNTYGGAPSIGYLDYDNIEEIFSLFTPKLLDEFESYFLEFCDPNPKNVTLKEEDITTGVKNSEQKSLLLQMKNIFFVDKTFVAISTEDETGKSLLEGQVRSMISGVGNFLNYDCILKIGNPGNFDRITFSDFTDDGSFISLPNKTSYGTYINDLPPDTTILLSQTNSTNNNQAWKKLYEYIGTSTLSGVTLNDVNSYVFSFFKDFNVKFDSNNIENLSQLLKIYVTKKIENSSYTTTNFKTELVKYLTELRSENTDTINEALRYLNNKLKNSNTNTNITNTNSSIYGDVLKLETYNVLKNFNDKWVAGSDFKNKLLFEDFLFHDRANVDIGDEYTVDIMKVLTSLKANDKKSIMNVLSNILTDNNFIFFALPSYINFYGIQSSVVKKQTIPVEIPNSMFATYLNVDYLNSKPKFLCIYVGKQSEYLQTTDSAFSKFGDDSFDMRNQSTNPLRVPASNIDYEKSSPVVGFNVDFGIMNQSIFKDVSLDMSEKKNTAETFAVNEQMGKAGAGDSVAQQSVSLYSIYKSRSYTCDVKAMGCAVIQPTMYFNLRHVPLFRGPYWISEVKHSISERGFETNFKGIRMPLFSLPKPQSFLMGVNKIFNERWKKIVTSKRDAKDVGSTTTFEQNLNNAPNPETNRSCISISVYSGGSPDYPVKPFITEVKTTISNADLKTAIDSNIPGTNKTDDAFRAWLFGISRTWISNSVGSTSITCTQNNLFGITCKNPVPQLNKYFTAQTCTSVVGFDTPVPTFTSTTEPIKFMHESYKNIVSGPINTIYDDNTINNSQNDIALSAITATTQVQILRLACSLAQLKLVGWDTNVIYNLPANEIYNYIKTQRTNGVLSDDEYLFYVKEFIIGIDNFGSASGFP
jgi:hypothetical protein